MRQRLSETPLHQPTAQYILAIALVGLVTGWLMTVGGVAPAAAESDMQSVSCTSGSGGAVYTTESNLTIYENDDSITYGSFPDDNTVQFQGGEIVFSAGGTADARLDDGTDGSVCLANVNATLNDISVRPNQLNNLALSGSFNAFWYEAITLNGDGTDIAYDAGSSAPEALTVKQTGLTDGTVVIAFNAATGAKIEEATTSGGAVTFSNLPAGTAQLDMEIRGGGYTVSLGDVPDRVVSGETITVPYEVTNTGSQPKSQDITFQVDGSTVGTREAVELNGRETTSGTFSYETSESDEPDVTVTVASNDDSAAADIGVREPRSNFEVEAAVEPSDDWTVGQELTVTGTITNTGEITDTQTVKLTSGPVLNSTDVSLGPGNTTTVTFEYEVQRDDAEILGLRIVTEDDDDIVIAGVSLPQVYVEKFVPEATQMTVGESLTVNATLVNTGSETNATVPFEIDGEVTAKQNVTVPSNGTAVSFTYTFNETGDYNVAIGTVRPIEISVLPPNTPPEATADRYLVPANTHLSIDQPGVLENDDDAENHTLAAELISQPDRGTVTMLRRGGFTYRPPENYTGTATFDYQVTDERGGTDTATVTVSVVTPTRGELSNLSIAGQGTRAVVTNSSAVPVTATVTNNGISNGSISVTATVANRSRTVTTDTLQRDESTAVTFADLGDGLAPGEYDVAVTTADDSMQGTVIIGEPETEFSLVATDSDVVAGDWLTATARVTNESPLDAEETFTLSVDGDRVDATTVVVPAGDTTNVSLSWVTQDGQDEPRDRGAYELTVAGNESSRSTTVWVAQNGSDRGPPPIVDGQRPRDVDDDGKFHDLDGDGVVTLRDIQLLFEVRTTFVVDDHAAYFDVTGDGEVTLADVEQILANRVTNAEAEAILARRS